MDLDAGTTQGPDGRRIPWCLDKHLTQKPQLDGSGLSERPTTVPSPATWNATHWSMSTRWRADRSLWK